MDYTIDAAGVLRAPNVHDGHLIGLELAEPKTLTARIRDLGGQLFTVRMSGLSTFLADEFRESNIIYALLITSGREPDPSVMRHLLGESHPKVAEEYRLKHEDFIAGQVNCVRTGELTLVVLESSYGCSFIALCQAVEIESV